MRKRSQYMSPSSQSLMFALLKQEVLGLQINLHVGN